MPTQTTVPLKPANASSAAMAIASQPSLDAKPAVFGYQLFDRSRGDAPFNAASDAALLFNLLSNAGSEALGGRKAMFINCTHQTLAGGHLELIDPERIVLEVPPIEQPTESEGSQTYLQTLTGVSKRGVRLAFDESVLTTPYASWLPLASFIKFDISKISPEQLADIVRQAAGAPEAQLVAERVETTARFELASRAGVGLFQGYWFAKPVLIKSHTIRPSQAAIIHLNNLVRKQASTTEIEQVFKHDPALSFNMLRFINSAGFGPSCEITPFRHAVMLLGRKQLFRWAALLMVSYGAAGSAPAVARVAVVWGG